MSLITVLERLLLPRLLLPSQELLGQVACSDASSQLFRGIPSGLLSTCLQVYASIEIRSLSIMYTCVFYALQNVSQIVLIGRRTFRLSVITELLTVSTLLMFITLLRNFISHVWTRDLSFFVNIAIVGYYFACASHRVWAHRRWILCLDNCQS